MSLQKPGKQYRQLILTNSDYLVGLVSGIAVKCGLVITFDYESPRNQSFLYVIAQGVCDFLTSPDKPSSLRLSMGRMISTGTFDNEKPVVGQAVLAHRMA